MEPDELFRRERGPVVLPSEEGLHRQRGLLTWMAVLIVVVGAAAGLTHHLLWQDVGSEVTRILPASTTSYVDATEPWSNLERAADLDRWADREALEQARLTRGLLADGLGGRVAAIPLPLVRRALLATDRLRVATIPTPEGTAWLVFARVADPWARRRLEAQLAPHLETVDRVMGYAVQALRADGGRLPWLEPPPPLRLVFMDDQVVVGVGPSKAIEDLVQARVTGLSQPLARHEGFRDAAGEGDPSGLQAWLDPTVLADVGQATLEEVLADPLRFRRLVVESLRAVHLRSTLGGADDRLEIRARFRSPGDGVEEEEATETPAPTFVGRPHTLLGRLPFDAEAAISASVAAPGPALITALKHLTRAAGLLSLPGWADHLVEMRARLRATGGSRQVARGLTGEAVLALPRGARPSPWLLALGVSDPQRGDRAIMSLVRSAVGPGWAVGTIYGEGAPLHVARPAAETTSPPPLAWTVRDDVAFIGPGPEALPDAGAGVPARLAAALGQSTRSLPPDAPLLALATPSFVAGAAPPWLAVVLSRLDPEFHLGAAAWGEQDAVVLRTNLGAWSVAAALSSLDRTAVGALALSDLSPACVEAWRELCATQPDTFLCEPLEPGRKDLLRRACERVEVSGPRR